MKASLPRNLTAWRKIKPEVVKELERLYNEDDQGSAIQVTAKALDKTFTANKFAVPKYLDAPGGLQLSMLRHTIAVTLAKSTGKARGTGKVLTAFNGKFSKWWTYLANVERQRVCFKTCYDGLLVQFPLCSDQWLPKWDSGLVQRFVERLNSDTYMEEVLRHKANGGLIGTLFGEITGWKNSLGLREKKMKEAEENAKKYDEEQLRIKRSVEELQLAVEHETLVMAQEAELKKAEAQKQKEQEHLVVEVAAAEANNKTEGTVKVMVTDAATRLAAKIQVNKDSQTAVLVTPTEQAVINAHKQTASRKRGRPVDASTVKTQLELFGSEPEVKLSSEEATDLSKRLFFFSTDTMSEGNPIPGIAVPEINFWKPILFPESGASGDQYRGNFAPYDLIFTSLEGLCISDAAIGEGGWAYWQIKIWGRLQAAGGVLLLVVSNSILNAFNLTTLLEVTGNYLVSEQPLMLITPSRNGGVPDSVAWVITAVKEGKDTVTVASPKDLEVDGKDRFGRQEFPRKAGIYKANATKPQFQLKTKEENFRRPMKGKKRTDKRIYKTALNLAFVCDMLDWFGSEGCSVYNGNGGLGGILPMAVVRMGRIGFFLMVSEEEMEAHKRRAAWAYKVFSSAALNALTGLGDPAKRPGGAEKWDEITKGISLREIHGEYLALQSNPAQALLQVGGQAKKRLKVCASNDEAIGTYLEELVEYAGERNEANNNLNVNPSMRTATYDASYEFDGFTLEDSGFLEKINAAYKNTEYSIEKKPPRAGRSDLESG